MLIPSNYSESTINVDIINGLHAIDAATGFSLFQCIKLAGYCSTDTSCIHPYNTQGTMHMIEGKITMYMTTRYV